MKSGTPSLFQAASSTSVPCVEEIDVGTNPDPTKPMTHSLACPVLTKGQSYRGG